MENKKAVKLTDFQKNEENPFMKQAIEGIENHVVKKYKSNSGGDKRAVVALADTETGEVFKTSFTFFLFLVCGKGCKKIFFGLFPYYA